MQAPATETDNWRQTKAMTWKHLVYKKRQMRVTIWEVLLPVLLIFYLVLLLKNPCDTRECSEEETVQQAYR